MQYSLFVQYAKALTPAEIIVLDRSPEALTLTRQWGADHQVLADGRHIEKVREITNGQGAEAVIDFVGEGGAVAAFWFHNREVPAACGWHFPVMAQHCAPFHGGELVQ